ncbi:MAG: hypothetical protein SO101_16270 [Lachnospiraceae bacterium]|nr:hypothetical protein [Lachnospiraceae bacterium]
MNHFRKEIKQNDLGIDNMETGDMRTDSLELIESHMEVLEEEMDPDMRFRGTEGIRRRFYEKTAAEKSEAGIMKKDADAGKKTMENAGVGKKMAENAGVGNGNTGTGRRKRRKVYLIMAAVLVLLCGMGAAASYGNWRLPTPDTYTGDIIKINETISYTWDEEKQAYVDASGNILQETGKTEEAAAGKETAETGKTEGAGKNEEADKPEETAGSDKTGETAAQTEQLTDAYFLKKTEEILELIGKEGVDTSQIRISYQKDESWNREEVMAAFPLENGEGQVSVTFDRETGYFLSSDRFGDEETPGNLMSEEDALAAARSWYEKLPCPEGYEYTYVNKFDNETWIYSFCRKADVEINGELLHLTNDYEEVRIGINPKNGDFVLCNTFYVPLLDDHKEGDAPLTEKEAVETAKGVLTDMGQAVSNAEISAEIVIAHPNYRFTSYSSTDSSTDDFRQASVTRLAWEITFDFPADEGFTNRMYIDVDLYTGEILGGDGTK